MLKMCSLVWEALLCVQMNTIWKAKCKLPERGGWQSSPRLWWFGECFWGECSVLLMLVWEFLCCLLSDFLRTSFSEPYSVRQPGQRLPHSVLIRS